tara:strand:+ start:424 stop:732 length:309 start_codon:yes stop_codon:yes gene_type:complete
MAGEKPRFKFVVKWKATGTSQGVAAFWERENGMISGVFENEIEAIILKDKTRINADQVWVNMYDNAKDNGGKHNAPTHKNPETGKAHWATTDGSPPVDNSPF